MRKLRSSAILSVILFGNIANCPADVTLSYTIDDGAGIASHRVSRTETRAIGTPVPGGVEYNFAFGAIGNDNGNRLIGEPTASLILYGPSDAVTGALLFLSGKTSALPFTVICDVVDRIRPGDVEFNFSATIGPIEAPLSRSAAFYGEFRSSNPSVSVEPSMVPTAIGSGGSRPVAFDFKIGPILEPLTISGLRGESDFVSNRKLHIDSGAVYLSPIYPASAAVPEPSSLLVAVCGASLGIGAWIICRRRSGGA